MIDSPSLEKKVPSSTFITCLFLFFLTFLSFSDSLNYGFVNWDDKIFVHENPLIRSVDQAGLWQMLVSHRGPSWQPLTWLSYAVNYHYFGLKPMAYHFTNVVIHCANVVWVFFLYRLVLRLANRGKHESWQIWIGAMVAALFFGLHPLRVESVAWISERKDVLYSFFFLPGLLAYLYYGSMVESRRKKFFYFLSLFCFFLSALSKEMAMTFPVVLLLLDIYPLNRWQTLNQSVALLREKFPFFIVSAGLAVITIFGLKSVEAILTLDAIPLSARLVNAVKSLVFYPEKTLIPIGLSPFYPFPKNLVVFDFRFYLSACILLAIAWFCFKKWKNGDRFWGVAFMYYLVTVSPVIGVVQVGAQAAADRYSYLTLLSGTFLMGSAIFLWKGHSFRCFKSKSTFPLLLGATVITLISLITVNQLKVWSNSVTLWGDVTQKYPKSVYLAHINLGNAYLQIGKLDWAKREYKIALENFKPRADSYNNLGVIDFIMGQDEEAVQKFKKSVSINPRFSNAHKNLGAVYYKQGKLDLAEKEFKLAIEYKPNYARAYIALGAIYFDRGKLDAAEQELKKGLEIDPKNPNGRKYLAKVYSKKGWHQKAEEEFAIAESSSKYIKDLEKDIQARMLESLK